MGNAQASALPIFYAILIPSHFFMAAVVDMPHSKADTAPGNKKGSLLNYGR